MIEIPKGFYFQKKWKQQEMESSLHLDTIQKQIMPPNET